MIDCEKEEIIATREPALEHFCYGNGYYLEGTDFGPLGVKIELSHPNEGRQAMILPPEKVREYVLWLLRTLKHRKNTKYPQKKTPAHSARTGKKRAS